MVPTTIAVQEALASGCLTTAFVLMQHTGLVHRLAAGDQPELARKWLAPLARGEVRAGLALGGALPKPTLRAEPDGDGWRLDGVSPFVSGWGWIDVIHAAARGADGEIVWLLADAAEGPSLGVEPVPEPEGALERLAGQLLGYEPVRGEPREVAVHVIEVLLGRLLERHLGGIRH